jgi:hypothetical protein
MRAVLALCFVLFASLAIAQEGRPAGPNPPCSAFGVVAGTCAQGNDARIPTGNWPTTTTNNDFLTFNGTTGAPQDSGTSWASPAALGTTTPAAINGTTGAFSGLLGTSGAGSATNPEIYVGNTTTGLYSVSTTGLGLSVNGTLQGDYGITNSGAWTFASNVELGNANVQINSTSGHFSTRSGNTLLTSPATATWQLGFTDAASPVAQTLQVQNVVAGTSNTAGVNWIMQGSLSTGTGVGGNILMKVAKTGTTGSTVNSAFPMISVNAGNATGATVQFGDGTNFTTYDSCTALTTGATGIIACTASAARFKEISTAVSPADADAGLDKLRVGAPVWNYKPEYASRFGEGPRVGLIADDVAKMDPRCVVEKDGGVSDYWDRCVIAYIVAAHENLKQQFDDYRRNHP